MTRYLDKNSEYIKKNHEEFKGMVFFFSEIPITFQNNLDNSDKKRERELGTIHRVKYYYWAFGVNIIKESQKNKRTRGSNRKKE